MHKVLTPIFRKLFKALTVKQTNENKNHIFADNIIDGFRLQID